MLCLLAQLQKKLQADLKTSNTKNHQKIELYWKSDNQGFKEATFIQVGKRGRHTEG